PPDIASFPPRRSSDLLMLAKFPVRIVELNHSALNVQGLPLNHCIYWNRSEITHKKPLDLMDGILVMVYQQDCQPMLLYPQPVYQDRKSTRLNSSHVSI